jgi:preprotein translocase subunit SecA
MFWSFLEKIFGSSNDRIVKSMMKEVQKINDLESHFEKMTNDELSHQTEIFKQQLANGKTLDDILVDAFATVREAGRRVLGLRLFDVQLVGGMVLHKGMLAEMKTGEGKTLVATLPSYLNGLTGKGVHLVTINDYLAQRDSEEMGKLHEFLGLKVGCIVHGLSDNQRREAYAADITYGTNHEFGFDYLRDNMKFSRNDMVQRSFSYAIVDEVDSILIDEARTPLIISGAAEDSSALYRGVNALIPQLIEDDYEKDEKQKSITLTEAGVEHIESLLKTNNLLQTNSLYDIQNISLVHHVNQALKAHKMFNRDVDYIVKDDKIVIIDEYTGRMMEGRRYSEGLHQALEAKENVKIEQENQTLASISYQNLFRLYDKLSGMTGTALTEAEEFEQIYKLNVVSIPTNLSVKRIDHEDEVYLTFREKNEVILKQIKTCHEKNQPTLVITPSIEKSEYMSDLLKTNNIPHHVLNARYHEQEAMIIAQAGAPGAVTIATNMAGRGTDIKLGGNLDLKIQQAIHEMPHDQHESIIKGVQQIHENEKQIALQAGGLFVLGTERNESRRIDNQARGRSGRQGDPGESKFFVSLEDDLMRIFGSERLDGMLRKLGVQEGEVISHPWISKALERAQKKVEARNFDIRKHLLRYDDVMSEQRKVIYKQRVEFMSSNNLLSTIVEMRESVIASILDIHIPEQAMIDQWDLNGLHTHCLEIFGMDINMEQWIDEPTITPEIIYERIKEITHVKYQLKEQTYGSDFMRHVEKNILLRALDQAWKDHLSTLDQLRQGINLRAYAQSNPINEYKREAFQLFEGLLSRVHLEVTGLTMHFTADMSNQSPTALAESILPEMPEGYESIDDELAVLDSMFSEIVTAHQTQDEALSEFLQRKVSLSDDVDLSHLNESERKFIEQMAHTFMIDEEMNQMVDMDPNDPCPCESGQKLSECCGKEIEEKI